MGKIKAQCGAKYLNKFPKVLYHYVDLCGSGRLVDLHIQEESIFVDLSFIHVWYYGMHYREGDCRVEVLYDKNSLELIKIYCNKPNFSIALSSISYEDYIERIKYTKKDMEYIKKVCDYNGK